MIFWFLVNLKAFPAVQALAGSWANSKLAPHHLEFVTMGKFVVKHARQSWFDLSSRMYGEPDLRRYALLRLTIINALIAMNKVYKQYMNKIDSGDWKLVETLTFLISICWISYIIYITIIFIKLSIHLLSADRGI